MIDFHSHILPGVDDGPETLQESLSMLRDSFLQSTDLMVSTSHFYGGDEYPREFLKRRNAAARQLKKAMLFSTEVYPRVALGAEVLFFSGISEAEGIELLQIGNSGSILIEPPMAPWTEDMLDEIQQLGRNFDLVPIIAHVDRYMTMLQDPTLIDRVLQRDLVVQVNGSYFLNPKTRKAAFVNLKAGKIQLIGSDCHNMESRPPNLGSVRKLAKDNQADSAFRQLHQNAADLLMNRRV